MPSKNNLNLQSQAGIGEVSFRIPPTSMGAPMVHTYTSPVETFKPRRKLSKSMAISITWVKSRLLNLYLKKKKEKVHLKKKKMTALNSKWVQAQLNKAQCWTLKLIIAFVLT